MSNLEKIHGLLDEIDFLLQSECPGFTGVCFHIADDGYRTIYVEKRDIYSDVPFDEKKSLCLLEQSCINGEWKPDESNRHNEWLKKNGMLWEEAEKNDAGT